MSTSELSLPRIRVEYWDTAMIICRAESLSDDYIMLISIPYLYSRTNSEYFCNYFFKRNRCNQNDRLGVVLVFPSSCIRVIMTYVELEELTRVNLFTRSSIQNR